MSRVFDTLHAHYDAFAAPVVARALAGDLPSALFLAVHVYVLHKYVLFPVFGWLAGCLMAKSIPKVTVEPTFEEKTDVLPEGKYKKFNPDILADPKGKV